MGHLVTEKQIQKIATKLAKEYHPEKIILFGSRAWGGAHGGSDIDLFVIKQSHQNPLELMREANRILFSRTFGIDVLVYTPQQLERRTKLGDPFLAKIMRSGKVLYDKKARRRFSH